MNTFSGNSYEGSNSKMPSVRAGPDHVLSSTTQDCVSSVRFSPADCAMTLVGVTSWDSTCSVWGVNVDTNAASGAVASQPMWSTADTAPPLALSFSADGRCFFGGCSKTAVSWDLSSGTKSVVATHDLPVSCMAFVQVPQMMGELLVTGSWDGKLRYWDLRQKTNAGAANPNCAKEENLGEPIFAMDVQKTSPMMAVATGRKVHLYNVNNGFAKVQELLPTDKVKFGFRDVACSFQYDSVAVATAEGRVTLLPIDGVKKPFTTRVHMKTATLDNLLKLGSVSYGSTRTESVRVMCQTNFVCTHPAMPILITGGGDGLLQVSNYAEKNTFVLEKEAVQFENENVPISAGDVHARGHLIAYAVSYDWSTGRQGWRQQPTSVHVCTLIPTR
ncbi:mRNA export factor [Strigomonas culicis]|uniref:mRNA export factor n=1 Tax=Strigomonas culicis TaxID=28005 RepID=S9UFM9_9TRYP|nr:mRNA export factor [Strigomonas culicis]|eukprot:EPY29602.1 mRNA export factor [Strigomonas culicis]